MELYPIFIRCPLQQDCQMYDSLITNSHSHNATRESMPLQYNRKKLMQIIPTRMCNVTARRHSRLSAHWLMALVGEGGGGAEGEVCILHSPGIAASPIYLLSIGGVYGRSLTAGKILFTGRQTCFLYLVLWLCELTDHILHSELRRISWLPSLNKSL